MSGVGCDDDWCTVWGWAMLGWATNDDDGVRGGTTMGGWVDGNGLVCQGNDARCNDDDDRTACGGAIATNKRDDGRQMGRQPACGKCRVDGMSMQSWRLDVSGSNALGERLADAIRCGGACMCVCVG